MNFLKLFVRGVAILPGAVQGMDSLYEWKSGEQKRQAVLDIIGSAIDIEQAVSTRQIASEEGFKQGLGKIVDGVVDCLNASIWHQR